MTDCNRSGLHSIEVWHRHYTTYMYVYSTYMHICESLSIKIDRYSQTHIRHGTAHEAKWNERNSAHTRRKYGRLRRRWQRLNKKRKDRERETEGARENQSRAAKNLLLFFVFHHSVVRPYGVFVLFSQRNAQNSFSVSFLFVFFFLKLTKNRWMPNTMYNHKKNTRIFFLQENLNQTKTPK